MRREKTAPAHLFTSPSSPLAGAPLSVNSGGKPSAPPIRPGTPGPRPKASQAYSLGAPPSAALIPSMVGNDGKVLNGLAPVTRSLLKSSPKADANS